MMDYWPAYFASVVSMQYHPGAGTREHKKLTLEECAEIADRMVELHKEREQKWRG